MEFVLNHALSKKDAEVRRDAHRDANGLALNPIPVGSPRGVVAPKIGEADRGHLGDIPFAPAHARGARQSAPIHRIGQEYPRGHDAAGRDAMKAHHGSPPPHYAEGDGARAVQLPQLPHAPAAVAHNSDWELIHAQMRSTGDSNLQKSRASYLTN